MQKTHLSIRSGFVNFTCCVLFCCFFLNIASNDLEKQTRGDPSVNDWSYGSLDCWSAALLSLVTSIHILLYAALPILSHSFQLTYATSIS